jgi:hypothetical protein
MGGLIEGGTFDNLLDALDGSYCTHDGGDSRQAVAPGMQRRPLTVSQFRTTIPRSVSKWIQIEKLRYSRFGARHKL